MINLKNHGAEIAREIRAHRYEETETGLLLNRMGVHLGGALKTSIYDPADELLARSVTPNLVTTQGLVHAVNVLFPPTGGYAQIAQWYIAPFSGNYTPAAGLTAANFASTATEFTAYAAAARPAVTINAASATASTGNTGAEALFVLNAGGPYTIRGFAILSSSAKSATTGTCFAGVRLPADMTGLAGGYKVGAEYVLSATDAG